MSVTSIEPVPDTATAARPTQADDGLFGPGSMTWRIVRNAALSVGGMRSLYIQTLHPLAMAGVAEHSNYAERPLDRMRRTGYYILASTLGDRATARRAAAKVRAIHRQVHGTDPVTGRRYSAENVDELLWVHCTEWHSMLIAHRTLVERLSQEQQDRFLAEGVRAAGLLGVPTDRVPSSVAEYREYFASVRPQLCVGQYAREGLDFLLNPPLTLDVVHAYLPVRLMMLGGLALVPRELRRLGGFDRPRAVDIATLVALRPYIASLNSLPARMASSLLAPPEISALLDRAWAV